jgi:hypothetical protein
MLRQHTDFSGLEQGRDYQLKMRTGRETMGGQLE